MVEHILELIKGVKKPKALQEGASILARLVDYFSFVYIPLKPLVDIAKQLHNHNNV